MLQYIIIKKNVINIKPTLTPAGVNLGLTLNLARVNRDWPYSRLSIEASLKGDVIVLHLINVNYWIDTEDGNEKLHQPYQSGLDGGLFQDWPYSGLPIEPSLKGDE